MPFSRIVTRSIRALGGWIDYSESRVPLVERATRLYMCSRAWTYVRKTPRSERANARADCSGCRGASTVSAAHRVGYTEWETSDNGEKGAIYTPSGDFSPLRVVRPTSLHRTNTKQQRKMLPMRLAKDQVDFLPNRRMRTSP